MTPLQKLTCKGKYECLVAALLMLCCLGMLNSAPNGLSFLKNATFIRIPVLMLLAWCFVCFFIKLTHWKTYRETTVGKASKLSHILFLIAEILFVITVLDRPVLGFMDVVSTSLHAESNPQDFLGSMVYMFYQGRSFFKIGVLNTVRIALLGTAVAFFLAILMAFLRVQKINKRDDDLVRFLKTIGNGFATFYINIIRGTPMMVQALIFYYAGFRIFKNTGMNVTQINQVWTPFLSGFITVSLNSTAYIAEVLRGGIEAIDAGQSEAARSLGMTSWQTMTHIVFPQAVKNSIPAIGNEFIINIKDSSVLSVIGCMDLMFATTSVSGIYFRSLECYCVAALIYLLLTWLSTLLMKKIAKKLDTPFKSLNSSN